MNLLIENEFLKVEANAYGAELHSIETKKNVTEFLWNGDENYYPKKSCWRR